MSDKKHPFLNQIKISLFFFLISALYGWILRLFKIVSFTTIEYKNILQAHSHVTFLGWGFLAIISLIGYVYFPNLLKKSRYLKSLFAIMSLSLFGVLVSFPIQGYKMFSIVFLSLFLLTSYLYLIVILKELKTLKNYSSRFIKTGIYYYFLSSLAIWIVPIIIMKFGKEAMYHNLIYFYLHFLYNGFFVFGLFGLLIKYIENQKITVLNKHVNYFFFVTNIACIPAYALSLFWIKIPEFVYYIGFIAALLQLISLFYLYKIYRSFLKWNNSKNINYFFVFITASYFLKITLQFLTVFPTIIEKAIVLKPYFIIGYLHLFTLGFMSLFLLLLIFLFSKIMLHKIGVMMLVFGIFLSEIFLFSQGLTILVFQQGIPLIDIILFTVSGLMIIGLVLIFSKSRLFLHA